MVRPVPIPNTAVKHSLADGSGSIGSARVGCRQFFPVSGRSGIFTRAACFVSSLIPTLTTDFPKVSSPQPSSQHRQDYGLFPFPGGHESIPFAILYVPGLAPEETPIEMPTIVAEAGLSSFLSKAILYRLLECFGDCLGSFTTTGCLLGATISIWVGPLHLHV